MKTVQKTLSTKGIVLRRINYGEADRIIDFLTPEGRVGAMARGVRKEKSKLAGGIELFAVSDIVLLKGRGELMTLRSARLDTFYGNIIKDYDRMQLAYNFIKLVYKNSELVESEQWFSVLDESLKALDRADMDVRLIEAWFLLRLSDFLGHEMSLYYDVEGERILEGSNYRYDIAEKGLRLTSQGDVTSKHIKLMRILATKPLEVMYAITDTGDVSDVCLVVARAHASI